MKYNVYSRGHRVWLVGPQCWAGSYLGGFSTGPGVTFRSERYFMERYGSNILIIPQAKSLPCLSEAERNGVTDA